MTTHDAGTWREHRAEWPNLTSLPVILYAIHDGMTRLNDGASGLLEHPDWTRATIDVRPSGTKTTVVIGAWCSPDGRTVEHAIPDYADDDMSDPARVTFVAAATAADLDGWTRVAGPWQAMT